jgi:uncharacterized lipoprotein YehR (DUF1307 family)
MFFLQKEEMIMKKIISVIFALILIFSLGAC